MATDSRGRYIKKPYGENNKNYEERTYHKHYIGEYCVFFPPLSEEQISQKQAVLGHRSPYLEHIKKACAKLTPEMRAEFVRQNPKKMAEVSQWNKKQRENPTMLLRLREAQSRAAKRRIAIYGNEAYANNTRYRVQLKRQIQAYAKKTGVHINTASMKTAELEKLLDYFATW